MKVLSSTTTHVPTYLLRSRMHRQSTTEESCALVVDTRDTQRQTQSSMRAILPSPNGDHLVKNCPLRWFSLAVFDGHLLAIGGKVRIEERGLKQDCLMGRGNDGVAALFSPHVHRSSFPSHFFLEVVLGRCQRKERCAQLQCRGVQCRRAIVELCRSTPSPLLHSNIPGA